MRNSFKSDEVGKASRGEEKRERKGNVAGDVFGGKDIIKGRDRPGPISFASLRGSSHPAGGIENLGSKRRSSLLMKLRPKNKSVTEGKKRQTPIGPRR